MADLRALFEHLGFVDVRTVLGSGNVVFASDVRPAEALARIEKGLARTLGLTTPVTVLTGNDVVTAVHDNPFSRVTMNPSHLLVAVPQQRSDLGRLRPLLERRYMPERLALGTRVAYVWCANGVPRSPLWAAVDRALEKTGTVQNIATLRRAAALLE